MFEQVIFLYLLILIPVFTIFYIWRGMVRASILRRMGDKELIQSLTAQISPFRRQVKIILWLISFAMLIFALARPAWGVEQEVIQTEGLQIVFAIDISRSMDANDVSPSRLSRARLDVLDMLNELEGNDIGIVLFAQEAFSYMPLTYDYTAAEIFIEGISTSMVTFQGTNIPVAIERAMGAFETRSQAQKIIILMTDGESHEGDAIISAQLASEESIRIYTIGYGTETGSSIPIYNDTGNLIGYHTGNESGSGTIVNTVLNVDLLQGVANETGGFYISGGIDLALLIADIQALESGEIGEQFITRPIERFSIFVVLSLLALSFEILLPETRREVDNA